jgi:signal transduction histidine kinase
MNLPLYKWTNQRVIHQLMLVMGAGLLTTVFLMMALFTHIYHRQLIQECHVVTQRVNRLLQVLLENVILQPHDLNSLRRLIANLGQHQEIHQAILFNNKQIVHNNYAEKEAESEGALFSNPAKNSFHSNLIFSKTALNLQRISQLFINEQGNEIFRQISPLFEKKSSCTDCHDADKKRLINATLLIDYDIKVIRERVWQNSLSFFSSVGVILFVIFLMMGWMIYRLLLKPLYSLLVVSEKLMSSEKLTVIVSEIQFDHTNENEFNRLKQTLFQLAQRVTNSQHREHEQNIFFQSLIDAIPDGIRVISSDYTIVLANQAYYQQLGLPATHSRHEPCYVSSHARYKPCSPKRVICAVHEILTYGQPIRTITEHVGAYGARLPVEICAAPMSIEQNGRQQVYVVESVRDLTPNFQVSQEQKLSVIGQMAASVAHDIKTPLSSIRLALQSTLRNLNTPQLNLAHTRNYLQLVDKQIDKCITITQRLLKLSTPDEEQQLLCLNEVIIETVALLAFDAKERKIEIYHNFKNAIYHVVAIESDIRMLVINLLQNAFNAMPQGGKIQITLSHFQNQIQMSIQDTGVGIHPNVLDNIFEPFFSRRADGKKSSGLGLSICKSIVERYHGHIEVSNCTQRGCQFLVTLPETHEKLMVNGE